MSGKALKSMECWVFLHWLGRGDYINNIIYLCLAIQTGCKSMLILIGLRLLVPGLVVM